MHHQDRRRLGARQDKVGPQDHIRPPETFQPRQLPPLQDKLQLPTHGNTLAPLQRVGNAQARRARRLPRPGARRKVGERGRPVRHLLAQRSGIMPDPRQPPRQRGGLHRHAQRPSILRSRIHERGRPKAVRPIPQRGNDRPYITPPAPQQPARNAPQRTQGHCQARPGGVAPQKLAGGGRDIIILEGIGVPEAG